MGGSIAAESVLPSTILIVDDIPTNLSLVVEYLEAHQFRVLVAQDGEEALRRAILVVPDLILLDVMMPGMDGFDVCGCLKADARTRDIPVIFMTSLADTHDKVAGFSAGAADYVTKPLHVEELMARVNAHLRLRALQRKLETQNAQLAAANEELQAFSYSVAHDLSSPLRAIMGFAQILREEEGAGLNKEGRESLDEITAAATRMATLIKDLLRYAEAGKEALQAVPVPLEPVIQQITATFLARIKSSGARFVVVDPLATPLGDPTLIGLILSNLVDNALKYCRKDTKPEVRLSAVCKDGQVVLRVTDNGIGIDPKHHDRVFGVFQRLHTAREYPGSGIGLAIVAKSARLMGGTASVKTAPGGGSTFCVGLPAADRQDGSNNWDALAV